MADRPSFSPPALTSLTTPLNDEGKLKQFLGSKEVSQIDQLEERCRDQNDH
jgi:hypothetical protein